MRRKRVSMAAKEMLPSLTEDQVREVIAWHRQVLADHRAAIRAAVEVTKTWKESKWEGLAGYHRAAAKAIVRTLYMLEQCAEYKRLISQRWECVS